MANQHPPKAPEPNGPDFSAVDSIAKAEELCRRGELERLRLLPTLFGGEDVPQNIVFVPPGIEEIKRGIDQNIIAPLAANGTVSRYTATPEYTGRSVIPIAIRVVASVPGHFVSDLAIWGQALGRG